MVQKLIWLPASDTTQCLSVNSFIPKLLLRWLWFFRQTAALSRQIRTFPQLFRFYSDLGDSGIRQIVRNSKLTTQQVEPSLQTARSTAVHHTLGILMPSRNQIQSDPTAWHTHDCLLVHRERVTVRVGLAIPRRLQQEQPCWRFGSGWFLDLPYHVVGIRQVLNTGDAHRARQHVCPTGSPGTAGGFTGVRSCDAAVLWFTFLCTV